MTFFTCQNFYTEGKWWKIKELVCRFHPLVQHPGQSLPIPTPSYGSVYKSLCIECWVGFWLLFLISLQWWNSALVGSKCFVPSRLIWGSYSTFLFSLLLEFDKSDFQQASVYLSHLGGGLYSWHLQLLWQIGHSFECNEIVMYFYWQWAS